MPLPSSGPISFVDLKTEFSGSDPISLSQYYRGGALVPDIAANVAVPTSGPISLSNFYGATASVPADLIPDAVNWANISQSTFDDTGSLTVDNANQTISGINQTITLTLDTVNGRAEVTPNTVGFGASVIVSVFKNNVFVTSITWNKNTTGADSATVNRTVNFTVAAGDTIKFRGELNVSGDNLTQAVGDVSASFNVKNASSGNTVLDTFTLSLEATYL